MGALLILIVCIDTCATGWCLARLRQMGNLCEALTVAYEEMSKPADQSQGE